MRNEYYDKWEFDNALELCDKNPYEAEKKFEEYLRKYPKDYSAYIYYIYTQIILGKFEYALEVLDYVEKESDADEYFNMEYNRVKLLHKNLLFSRMKLLSYNGKYEELCQLYYKNTVHLEDINLKAVIFYSKKQLGKLDPNRRDINSYLYRQIVEYKESDFMEHIQKHMADFNAGLEEPNESIFVSSFPIGKIIEEIKKYIPSERGLHFGFYEDIYIFKYNGCGRSNNKLVDYFKVVCFHKTQDFITICPAEKCEKLPYVDLNYLYPENSSVKVKKLSQIEKFNIKYRKK